MYQLARPAAELSPYIEHYWAVYATPESPVDLTVDVFVDGRADLIFNFGAPYTREVLHRGRRLVRRSNLDAQRLAPIRIAQRGDVVITGVRFRTAGLSPFVRHPVHAWNDRTVGPVEAFGADAARLERSLADTVCDVGSQAKALDAFFLRRLELSPPVQTVLALTREIDAAAGSLRVDALLRRREASARHVNRLFRQHVGFGPKTLARIARFQRALTALKRPYDGTMGELAAACGYYDQSHFVRDFRRFAGAVPTRQAGYFPDEAPHDFSPNLVQFVQDGGGPWVQTVRP